jgi:peptide/nickel transport system substrate-binding protein
MGDWIRIYHPSDPDGLHPYNTVSAHAATIKENIFMSLFDYDPGSMEHVPTLAEGTPEISADGLSFTYEIRPEAKWDNGDPVTGYDYEFSMKCLQSPLTDNAHSKTYYSFIQDVKVDPANARRFTVFTATPYFRAETSISDILVLSREFYDPGHLMSKFTVLDMNSRPEEVAQDPGFIQFSKAFNSDSNGTNPARIYGSGPYKVESYTPGDNVTLVRKKDWWGDQLHGASWYFQAYAQRLIFKTIRDRTTVLAAGKNGELDVMRNVPPDDFVAAREDTAGLIYQNFNFLTPTSYSTNYLGFNCRPPADRSPVVAEVAVREAIAHLTDIDGILQNVYLGFGQRQNGPISPLHRDEYHAGLKPRAFDPGKSKQILDAAGWVDADGDGIREKKMGGKTVPLKIEVLISNTSETGPRTVKMIADQAQRVGIQMNITKMAFGTLMERIRVHDFDMYAGGFQSSPLPTDLKQLWATENWVNNGSNYSGFGNATTDSLIEQIRVTLSPEARKPLYWKFQEIFHAEIPVIVLMAPQERILVHKRIRNARPTELSPGTKPIEFWVPLAEQRYR